MTNGAAGNGVLGGANARGTMVTIVVVSSDVSGNSAYCNGGTFMLVNGAVSSGDDPFNGGASLRASVYKILGSVASK